MLTIQNITKTYTTGTLTQVALDNVSVSFRESEFVAILGASGSGKTTLLNLIGGLDRYDSGDIILDGISTKEYKDRDWDSYRNHTIGFVFQSYNLISHQSILSNVELALTISGIRASERKERAKQALEQVGLGEHIHKRPSQLSGGQMQRVAIARALVNNPSIVLADEPTGALDTETSVTIMEILKEISKTRLVVMVTHNPELAEKYATRIVKVSDGHIINDSDPVFDTTVRTGEHKNLGHSSMSFLTALSLSFNNLRTKKARTILTAFAGSIGIIGIALILSFSTGMNKYIEDIQKETMVNYPISIEQQTFDYETLLNGQSFSSSKKEHDKDGVYRNTSDIESEQSVTNSVLKNNLTRFKEYLDDENSEIHKYVGSNGISYSYDISFGAFTYDSEGTLINTDGSNFSKERENSVFNSSALISMPMPGMTGNTKNNQFRQLTPDPNTNLVNETIVKDYQLLVGKYPENYDEVVLITDSKGELLSSRMYNLGLLPASEYNKILKSINEGEELDLELTKVSFDDVIGKEYDLLPISDYYIKNDSGYFDKITTFKEAEKLLPDAIKVKIVGVIAEPEDDNNRVRSSMQQGIGYTKALSDKLIEHILASDVIVSQQENESINVLNGLSFTPKSDSEKIADLKNYIDSLGVSDKANLYKTILSEAASMGYGGADLSSMSENDMAMALMAFTSQATDEYMLLLYDNIISTGSYEQNMQDFGYVSKDSPSAINIYSDSFEAKDNITRCITDYNETVSDEDKITYTDFVGLLMSSITTIINIISYVLIAFVAVSLVVSSIMIGIITYISVLERTKEIGILRAIGASKANISSVFNAETCIIGFLSGIIGIGVTLLLLIPANIIIHAVAGNNDVSAILPWLGAIILIALSVALTFIGGLIPSSKAAKQDAVKALRTD